MIIASNDIKLRTLFHFHQHGYHCHFHIMEILNSCRRHEPNESAKNKSTTGLYCRDIMARIKERVDSFGLI